LQDQVNNLAGAIVDTGRITPASLGKSAYCHFKSSVFFLREGKSMEMAVSIGVDLP
jgi:hypothetical protein